jgi:hypothetical protein
MPILQAGSVYELTLEGPSLGAVPCDFSSIY